MIPAGEDRNEYIARTLHPDFGIKGTTVTLVGEDASGGYYVDLVDPNGNSYNLYWPQWAYNLARAALLYNKPLSFTYPAGLGENVPLIVRITN